MKVNIREAQEGYTRSWLCYKGILDKGEEEDKSQWERK